MPTLSGRDEVDRLKKRLDATFQRVALIDPSLIELRSDMAKHLCVLVAGYVEQATQALAIAWCANHASDSVQRYATGQLRRLQNVNGEKLKATLGAFKPSWRDQLEAAYSDQIVALDSVYGNRHQIAHGADVGLTVSQITTYYGEIQQLISFMAQNLDP